MQFKEIINPKMEEKYGGNEYVIKKDCNVVVMSDLHIDYKKKRPDYFWETLGYLDAIIEKMENLGNPVFISLGDLFNKDLNNAKGLLYYEQVLRRFKKIEEITEGRCFIVMGNHEDTYYSINPTLLLTKPSPDLMQIMSDNKKGELPDREFGGILKTPKTIRIRDTKISLNHFNKYHKDYDKNIITGDCEFHIGLFHDTFTSDALRNAVDNKIPVDRIWKNELSQLRLDSMDLAIFGDFHIPIPPFQLANVRETYVVIPGTLGRNNIKTEKHNSVLIPVIKVSKGERTKVSLEPLPLKDWRSSYNLSDSLSSTNDISNKIRKMVKGIRADTQKNINTENFVKFIKESYGVDWEAKVYEYILNIERRI